ncbi:MAG TPA: hypothetical protein DCQ64_00375, partial [Candidatus Rokubacteria bacterium]|nr:hypothetical protein [Candidatus Rokubacteria bacterium]
MFRINTQPWPQAHFAVWPEELARRILLFACPERVCAVCGRPWERVTERDGANQANEDGIAKGVPRQVANLYVTKQRGTVHPVGWRPTCACDAGTRAGVALDPFGGSGTTGVVADQLGRDAVLAELNPAFVEMARRRVQRASPLLAQVEVQTVPPPPHAPLPLEGVGERRCAS